MTGHATDDRLDFVDRGLQFGILAGVAIGLGLVIIVTVGIAARVEGLSAGSFLQLLLLFVLLWPVYRLKPWRSGVSERVRNWVRSNRAPLALAATLLVVGRLPFAPDLLAAFVYFPFVQTGGYFFGAELFYRPYVGFELGVSIRRFGQWYVTIFLVLVISVIVIDATNALTSVGDEDQ